MRTSVDEDDVVRVTPVAVAILLSGCQPKVSPAAVYEVSMMLGRQSRSLELADDDLAALSKKFSVPAQTLGDVAPAVEKDPAWSAWVQSVQAIQSRTDGPTCTVVIGTACDILGPTQASDENVELRVATQTGGLSAPRLKSLADDVKQLRTDLEAAAKTGDRGKATVAVICFSAKRL